MVSFFLFFSFFIQELVIGEERLDPGIVFIFEGAIKDQIYPEALHLKEEETNIHIEARVNWDDKNIKHLFFIGTKHPDFTTYSYNQGSIIIDPWRYIPEQNNCEVIKVGENT